MLPILSIVLDVIPSMGIYSVQLAIVRGLAVPSMDACVDVAISVNYPLLLKRTMPTYHTYQKLNQ